MWQGEYAIYLAKVGSSMAGFAVVGSARQWLGRADVRDMKDFFVLRRFRHQSVANAFAMHLWNEFPGEWLIRVLVAHKPALPFWRRTACDYMQGKFAEHGVLERSGEWIHLRFDSRERS